MYLRTLGKLDLEGSELRRPKLLLLLTYLAIEGPKSRRHLAELLWPDAANAATSVRMALRQVRLDAPLTLVDGPQPVRLALQCDAGEFLARIDAGDLTAAVGLYEGPFMPGFLVPGWGAEIEEWVTATRELLAERARHALLNLGERAAGAGHHHSGAGHARRAFMLEAAPPPESGDYRRLHALLAAGDSPLATDVARSAREYGLELTLTPDEARRQLMRAAPTTTVRRVTSFPAKRTTEFVGRDLEMLEVARLLARSGTNLVSVIGTGGVGKTSLAVQIAAGEAQDGHYPDGVHCVALETLDQPELLPQTLADGLGLTLSADRSPLAGLIEMLKDRTALVVLDNFEHLLAGVATLGELLAACPGVKLLVTSREPLGLAIEQVFHLEGMPVPDSAASIAEAQLNEAVALFVQRAKRVRLDFTLSEGQLPAVIEICRLVDGVPLGIELAAVCVRFMPPDDIVTELANNLDLLTTTARDVPSRHLSVRATFEHSWSLLTPAQQTLLAGLSVFAGGFTREAASRVVEATTSSLAVLVDKSLVRSQTNGRYDLHPLVKAFALEKLALAPGDLQTVRSRHATYFADVAEAAEQGLKGHEQGAWFRRLDADIDNLRASLGYALEAPDVPPVHQPGALDHGLRILGALWRYWPARGRASEWLSWYVRLLTHPAGMAASAVRAKALSGAGTLAFDRHELDVARTYHLEALAIRRQLGLAWGVAASLYNLGGVHAARREYAEAQPLFEDSLAVMRELGDTWNVALALENLGLLASKLGNFESAHERLAESVRLRRELGDDRALAASLKQVASLSAVMGDDAAAEATLREVLRIEHVSADVPVIATSLDAFARFAADAGAITHAVRLWAAASAARKEVDATPSPDGAVKLSSEVEAARSLLGEEEFTAAWRQGESLGLDAAVEKALAGPGPSFVQRR